MTDNFSQIRSLMDFRSEDDFYYMIILKRKKENPDVGSNSYAVKHYFFKSREELDLREQEIRDLCALFNARACIYLNRRSYERCAFHTLGKISNILMGKDYKEVKKAYTSVCGMHNNETEKRWILDVDDRGVDAEAVINHIHDLKPVGDKFITRIETKNGYHLITKPFDVSHFGYSDIQIQKDNPTLLFIP